jgi:hypothetical protein
VDRGAARNLQLGIAGGDDRWRVWAWADLLDEEYFTRC